MSVLGTQVATPLSVRLHLLQCTEMVASLRLTEVSNAKEETTVEVSALSRIKLGLRGEAHGFDEVTET